MSKKNIIFGTRSVIEAIESGRNFEKILVKKSRNSPLQDELLVLLRKHRVPYQFVPTEKLNRVSGKNHQGVIAFLSEITYQRIENIIPFIYEQGKTPFILIADGITDVRNFGAMARTAECAGIHAIIIPVKGTAQINADAVKTSAGALHKIPVCRSFDLEETISFLKSSGLEIIGATEKSDLSYDSADYTKPVAIVVGSEDTGISKEILNLCDHTAGIPIYGEIASLNVSVAAAVFLYEAVRQRKHNKN